MVNKKWTCFFHWTKFFNKHTKHLIGTKFHDQHKTFCYEYNKTMSFNMLPFGLGGIRLELPMGVPLKSSTIGQAFGTFMCDDGEASC
jgi:hypothetical protein